jgi:hypothetical protein
VLEITVPNCKENFPLVWQLFLVAAVTSLLQVLMPVWDRQMKERLERTIGGRKSE